MAFMIRRIEEASLRLVSLRRDGGGGEPREFSAVCLPYCVAIFADGTARNLEAKSKLINFGKLILGILEMEAKCWCWVGNQMTL